MPNTFCEGEDSLSGVHTHCRHTAVFSAAHTDKEDGAVQCRIFAPAKPAFPGAVRFGTVHDCVRAADITGFIVFAFITAPGTMLCWNVPCITSYLLRDSGRIFMKDRSNCCKGGPLQ